MRVGSLLEGSLVQPPPLERPPDLSLHPRDRIVRIDRILMTITAGKLVVDEAVVGAVVALLDYELAVRKLLGLLPVIFASINRAQPDALSRSRSPRRGGSSWMETSAIASCRLAMRSLTSALPGFVLLTSYSCSALSCDQGLFGTRSCMFACNDFVPLTARTAL